MSTDTSDGRLSRALDLAARRYGEALRSAERDGLAALEAGFLLARLGLDPALATPPNPSGDVASTLADDRAAALARLQHENRRLVRLARAAHPAYDLNRHIAVRRLAATFEPNPAAQATPRPSRRDRSRTRNTPIPRTPASSPPRPSHR